jgi:hypothetical protein
MKTLSRMAVALSLCTALFAGPALAEGMKGEKAEHPRIAKAIHELEDAIKYMEEAPHDFGGHKAAALESSKKAVADLKEALAYRAAVDTKKGK